MPLVFLPAGAAPEVGTPRRDADSQMGGDAGEDADADTASMYSSSFSSAISAASSFPQLAATAPSSPIITRRAAPSDNTMGRLAQPHAGSVSFTSDAAPWASKSHCGWTETPSSLVMQQEQQESTTSNINTTLLKDLLNDAMQSTSSSTANLHATSSMHSIRATDVPMPLHSRMGRRMGMAAASSIVPLSAPFMNSSPAVSAAMPASTPMMSRTSSEASTSSTCTSSSMSTILTDDFRFDDDDELDQEELDDEDITDDEDVYCSSSDAASSRGAGHSSCPSTSSLDSFTLPRDCFPSAASSLASFSIASSSAASSSSSTKAQQKRIETPYTFPSPTPISELRASDLEASLRFSSASSSGSTPTTPSSEEQSAPPAFFPLQRVSFAPQLKIKTQGGVPLAMNNTAAKGDEHGISGMMLGVTGTVEVLDAEKSRKTGRDVIKSQRMIADFATDLTNGLRIWRRDASPIVKEKISVERQWRRKYGLAEDDLDDERWDEMLAPGTFMLPLSMKIPCSDKLPPSFESAHFRIRYVMSLAIFGSHKGPDGKPEVLHVHSIPFTILPSTLPSPAPQIPVLTHDSRKTSFFSGMARALSLGGSGQPPAPRLSDKSCTHIICPSIPTSSYSPGSVIPITLRIADCPVEPTDLYIRLSLVRKLFVRDASQPMVNEWGLPDDLFMEEFCKEEEEIVSRWGYVPYSVRAQEGATPGSKAQVIISDITLPVGNGLNGEWTHGYSCGLDLAPTLSPSMKHGECSWFSPALSRRPPAKQEYERYIHASTRHYISIEVGFASDRLGDVLRHVGNAVQDMEVPQANTFTHPATPSLSECTGLPTTNPFPSAATVARAKRNGSIFNTFPSLPSFPGKLKEILIPITIGSVAEPQLSCLLSRNSDSQPSVIPSPPRGSGTPQRAATAEESADRAARDADESEVERYERVGDDGEEPWLLPPPSYATAVTTAPAYI